MDLIERERLAVDCLRCMESRGLRLEVVNDPTRASKLLDSTGRAYSTFPLDPKRVAFTRKSAFWLFAMLGDEVWMGCGVRMDDLGDEPFGEYFQRTSIPTFGQVMCPEAVRFPTDAIAGRAAYWGDMISPARPSKGLDSVFLLRVFCYFAQHRVFADLNADCSYCFMQDRMYLRGAPQAYGFLRSLPFVWDWEVMPFPAGRPDWVSILRKNELDLLGFGLRKLLVDKGAVD